ncbi:unnamed protein product [Discula destructiva]
MSTTPERPVFVLAPGAWHTPDCFEILEDKLHAQGYETAAVAYPSVGAEPPTKGLYDDAAAVRAEIEVHAGQGRQVIIVVHSYGGLVGAEAVKGLGYKQRQAEGKKGGVTLLVYLAAFVTPKGLSITKMLGGEPLPWMNIQGERVIADTPEDIFYHDVPEDLKAKAISKLKHQSAAVFQDEVTYQPWEDMECMYFYCEDDRALVHPVQKQFGATLGENAISYTCKGSHSPFLSEPDTVVEGLLYGASEVQKRL